MTEFNDRDIAELNDRVIAEFRANRGHVGSFGTNLVLLHSQGARSGVERVNPVLSLHDGHHRLIIASAAGSLTNPGWYYNLLARPDITIETPEGSTQVSARELDGDEYAVAWGLFDAASPQLAQYQQQAGSRRIPIFRLLPRSSTHENR